ncbi:hypothetical protein GLAREA_09304 [Glarea lozoyensis ATCC 20868]|uniref:Uncharacterized protein n=1 Tax=Glarea lozoyensis (strain ATCC 20868 / MF5171) TaxID=1116229 RepID=S3DYX5_GLAL2|nr:uncharacterized protein GLAREA_09304 [Glarea lozoyensis ATCC 20868]EPE37141.1 hypothetical protein GLAREA_09304 [Glarea lozoyensis ATCC 20868]
MLSSPISLVFLALATGALASVNEVLPRMDLGMELEMREEFAVFPRAGETNFQTFTAALLSKVADPVIANGGSDPTKPFTCNGDTFSTLTDALKRSCSNQKNDCAKAVNDALSSKTDGGLQVSDCDAQEKECNSAGAGGLASKDLQDGKADQLVFC